MLIKKSLKNPALLKSTKNCNQKARLLLIKKQKAIITNTSCKQNNT